jgi:hypothetical protein
MDSMTLDQLRAARAAGGVAGVMLKAAGRAFFIEIETRSGKRAVLAKARSADPRRFGNPLAALSVLRAVGITAGQFDSAEWDPGAPEQETGKRGRAEAMREAHRATAYNRWLRGEITASVEDGRNNIEHKKVMADFEAEITSFERKRSKAGANKRT